MQTACAAMTKPEKRLENDLIARDTCGCAVAWISRDMDAETRRYHVNGLLSVGLTLYKVSLLNTPKFFTSTCSRHQKESDPCTD